MSKYYEAEKVERLIDNICNAVIGNEELVEMFLSGLSTIDIVHCRECKYNETGHCPMAWWDDTLQTLLNSCDADDFCSKGKREEE